MRHISGVASFNFLLLRLSLCSALIFFSCPMFMCGNFSFFFALRRLVLCCFPFCSEVLTCGDPCRPTGGIWYADRFLSFGALWRPSRASGVHLYVRLISYTNLMLLVRVDEPRPNFPFRSFFFSATLVAFLPSCCSFLTCALYAPRTLLRADYVALCAPLCSVLRVHVVRR